MYLLGAFDCVVNPAIILYALNGDLLHKQHSAFYCTFKTTMFHYNWSHCSYAATVHAVNFTLQTAVAVMPSYCDHKWYMYKMFYLSYY